MSERTRPHGHDRPAVRRHHRRRHGAGVASPCRCRTPRRRGRRGPAGQQDGHGPGAGRARQADGPGLHVLRRLRPGQPPRRHQQGRGRRARLPAADAQGGQRRDQGARCAAGSSSSAPASAPTRTPSASTRSSTSRGSRGRRAWSTTASSRSSTSAPRSSVPAAGRARPARRRPTPSWSPRSSPSATRTCSTPARCRRRSARPTRADRRPLLVVGGPRFDETMAAELGVDRVFGRGTTPGEVASFLVHRIAPAPAAREAVLMPAEVGTRVVHRRYVPYSARPLRRQPGRRRLLPRAVRRRRHRGVHPHRRRRGPVRVVLRRAVPGAGAGRRRPRDHLRGDPGRHPLARPRPGRVRRGARRGDRRRPGAAACSTEPIVATTATGTVVVPRPDRNTAIRRVAHDTPSKAQDFAVDLRRRVTPALTCGFARCRRSGRG